MADVFLNGSASPAEVLDTLSLYGVAVLDGHVPDVRAARDEFMLLMDEQKSSASFLQLNKSRVARIYSALPSKWTYLRAPLYSPFVHDIAAGFYGPHTFDLNTNTYLTHDVDATDFNGGWHNDPTRSLKFMVYLNDVDERNGAMRYIPGSNYHGIHRILSHRLRGTDDFPVFLPANEVPEGAISLNGRAGTLIVFDTAGFHTAGNVQPGNERLVVRGHSFPKRTIGARMGNRIRQSALNLLKHIQTDDELVADRFKSRAKRAP